MKGFLYRDLCGVKRMGKFMWIIVVSFGAMTFVGEPHSMQFLLPIYSVIMLANQLVDEDEKSGWMGFAGAVPDGRRKMVRSKYSIVGLTAGVTFLLEILLAVGLAATGKQELLFSLQVGLVAVGVAVLMAEIALPVEYTFGYRDGAFFSVLISALLLFVTGASAYKGMQAHDWELRGLNILILVPVVAAIAFYPSYRASVSACGRREF